MWVSKNFDAITINIDILQQNLSENLMGKRFLLVLDDVWHEDHHKWQRYRASLVSGKKGSKIVAITQKKNVESVMGGLSPYRLQRLSDDSCWSLCSKIVHFLMATLVDILDLRKLERKLLKSSRDCHLQQRQLGAFCTQKSKVEEEEWKEILRSEIWEDKNSILPAFRLSSKHLPVHLKQCFAFCAVFHKDCV